MHMIPFDLISSVVAKVINLVDDWHTAPQSLLFAWLIILKMSVQLAKHLDSEIDR
jgi:hypothetical protein